MLTWREDDLDRIIRTLQAAFGRGEPAIVPTDTLYGIAAPVDNDVAIERIFRLKGRPRSMTLPIVLGDPGKISDLAYVDGWRREFILTHLPGPYTLILRTKNMTDPLLVREGTVAVRVPDHPLFLRLTEAVGPVAMTSANPHGSPDILSAAELDVLFTGSLSVVEDDRSISGAASEIIDLTGDSPRVLRPGKINKRIAMEGPDG